jgi:ankyrin repeat protein
LFADTAAKHSVYTLESLWPKNTSYRTSPLLEILDTVPSPEIEALVRKFKEHGYDIDEKWSRHSCGRPLQHCCSWAGTDKRKERAAFLLLGLGANPNPPKKPWRSNLKRALEGNAPDLYNALLRHPLINLGDKDQRDQTLLHVLVQTAPMERICEVLDVIHDVDINVQDVNGYTPLHLAVSGGRVEVVRKLLTVSGIRLDLADKQGRTAFTLATYWGMKSMALVLIEHSQAFPVPEAGQVSALVFAAIQQEKALCFRLLEMSSYRNLHLHMDMSGKCILHHAAMNNWEDVLDSCVSLGGPALNLNQIDKSGRSALHYAAALGNVDACCVLVASGASLTLQDRNGRTAAHASADAGFKDALMVLLRSGRVNPNQRDLEGRNLVHWAATLDCVDVMEVIRDTDMPEAVELARRDKYDKMPIDIAFRCRCKHVGQFLAREMRAASNYNDIYNWDNMYRSREVLDVELQAVLAMDRQWSFVTVKEEFDMLAADKQDDRKRAQELRSHRRSRQQLEWPDKLWGIVKHKASDAEQ